MNREPSPLRRWAPVIAWAALIYALSSRQTLPGIGFPHADKILHAFEFAVLAWLLARALFPSAPISRLRARALWAAAGIFCLIYALSDEFHQSLVPGRTCEISDLVADSVGILSGLTAFRLFKRRGRDSFP